MVVHYVLGGPLDSLVTRELQVEVADERGQFYWREITAEERRAFRAQGWSFGEMADGS